MGWSSVGSQMLREHCPRVRDDDRRVGAAPAFSCLADIGSLLATFYGLQDWRIATASLLQSWVRHMVAGKVLRIVYKIMINKLI